MKVTLISDTHTQHARVGKDLPGGDLLIHAGDFMASGYNPMEAMLFFKWFDEIDNYDTKVFIAGNHDRYMQDYPTEAKYLLDKHLTISYLEDNMLSKYVNETTDVKIYGTPWQPEFYNWAFNLPRNGSELQSKWDAIPDNTDILVTHGPAYGFLDDVEGRRGQHLGCELLTERIKAFKPKIHVCGHIHTGHGHYFDGHTHFFNAALLDERYRYTQSAWNFEWNPISNEIEWLTI